MPLYRDEGVVLRTTKLGEADRIVTLLTRSHGKIRAVAKGVRRVKSRFGGRLEPFMRVDVLIATGRTLDVVSQAESISGGSFTHMTLPGDMSVVSMVVRLCFKKKANSDENRRMVY